MKGPAFTTILLKSDFSNFNPKLEFEDLLTELTNYIYDSVEWNWLFRIVFEYDLVTSSFDRSACTHEQALFIEGLKRSIQYGIHQYILWDSLGYFDQIRIFYNKYSLYTMPIVTLHTMHSHYTPELPWLDSFCRDIISDYIINDKVGLTYSAIIADGVLIYHSFVDYLLFLSFLLAVWALAWNIKSMFYIETYSYFDYSIAFSYIVAEKELGSLDDYINLTSSLFFFFGWFTFVNGIVSSVFAVEVGLFLLFLPLFVFSLILMPLSLLLDYGCSFINYLRGTASTSSFTIEFLFDYVTLFAFLMRNFVQNVRFLIILLISYELNELFVYIDLPSHYDYCLSKASHLKIRVKGLKSTGFESFLAVMMFKTFYFLYELVHAFFIIVVQTSSFLIMVFWLFSFLYTYFHSETQETYFSVFRKILRMRAKHFMNTLEGLNGKNTYSSTTCYFV